eukprot:gene4268-8494_t
MLPNNGWLYLSALVDADGTGGRGQHPIFRPGHIYRCNPSLQQIFFRAENVRGASVRDCEES